MIYCNKHWTFDELAPNTDILRFGTMVYLVIADYDSLNLYFIALTVGQLTHHI